MALHCILGEGEFLFPLDADVIVAFQPVASVLVVNAPRFL
jgi:hypothetical protein